MTPCNFLLASAECPVVIICDVRVVEAMYTTKNKYFDKHWIMPDFTYPLMGDTILFSSTTHEWRTSRKAMSPAFYKGKLVQMVELAKISMRTTLAKLKSLAEAGGPKTTIDLMAEVSMMQVRILLRCALGEDVSDHEIDYWSKGRLGKRCLSYALREAFAGCVDRITHPQCFLLGSIANRNFVLPYERDLKANCVALRKFISDIVEKRRAHLAQNPRHATAEGDFLTILLTEPHFKDNGERIIDECLTFFFAGS